jgi:hypothetical protein
VLPRVEIRAEIDGKAKRRERERGREGKTERKKES